MQYTVINKGVDALNQIEQLRKNLNKVREQLNTVMGHLNQSLHEF